MTSLTRSSRVLRSAGASAGNSRDTSATSHFFANRADSKRHVADVVDRVSAKKARNIKKTSDSPSQTAVASSTTDLSLPDSSNDAVTQAATSNGASSAMPTTPIKKTRTQTDDNSKISTPKATATPKTTPRKRQSPYYAKPFPAPLGWQALWDRLVEYRRDIVAPVDTVGCDRLHHADAPPAVRRFHILLALLLSSQTKDGVTAEAMNQLHRVVGANTGYGVTVGAMLATDDATVNDCIKKVGFHRRKTEYIRQVSQILRESYNDDIPRTVDEIMAMPGLGPKMAHLAVQAAWQR